ncbi:MAG: hypothetical protein FWG53_02580, partial [Clostridiales bacterium]|nr:hypothetical protein [Clostridiales bacterium]
MLEDFISSVDSTENIYDLIACCSDSIFSVVLNEELFMAEYVDLPPKYQCLRRNQKLIMKQSGSWQNASLRKWLKKMRAYKKRHEINPNLDNLNVLSGSIVRIFDSIKPEEVSMYYAEFKKSLLVLLREFKLVAFLEDPLYNQATIPFFVLRVLDSLLAKLLKFQKKYLGPMGNYRRYKTLVYFADNHTIISEASMQLGFRGKVHPERIQDIVVNLRLVRVDQISAGAAIPKILRIDIDKDQANSLNFCVTNKLSIAFIPYSIHREFAFKPSIGSSFTIKYNDIDEEVMKNRCHALLDCAIQGGANIIAFPEYIISEKMLHEIKSFLKIKMLEEPKSLEKLVMVIAGSTWIENDNNVLHILNRHGTEIAKYYKYSPFTKREKSRQTRDI